MSTNYKADFPLLAQRDVAYLDSAATAQRPQCVLDAEREFYTRHNANPLRGLYPLSIEATDALASAVAIPVIASGGVSSMADLIALRDSGTIAGAISGRALYDGAIDLAAALARLRG